VTAGDRPAVKAADFAFLSPFGISGDGGIRTQVMLPPSGQRVLYDMGPGSVWLVVGAQVAEVQAVHPSRGRIVRAVARSARFNPENHGAMITPSRSPRFPS
jgi:hypothetical protein